MENAPPPTLGRRTWFRMGSLSRMEPPPPTPVEPPQPAARLFLRPRLVEPLTQSTNQQQTSSPPPPPSPQPPVRSPPLMELPPPTPVEPLQPVARLFLRPRLVEPLTQSTNQQQTSSPPPPPSPQLPVWSPPEVQPTPSLSPPAAFSPPRPETTTMLVQANRKVPEAKSELHRATTHTETHTARKTWDDDGDDKMRRISIVGENKGAFMELIRSPSSNSNVQSLNNSLIANCSFTHKSPGLHLTLSHRP